MVSVCERCLRLSAAAAARRDASSAYSSSLSFRFRFMRRLERVSSSRWLAVVAFPLPTARSMSSLICSSCSRPAESTATIEPSFNVAGSRTSPTPTRTRRTTFNPMASAIRRIKRLRPSVTTISNHCPRVAPMRSLLPMRTLTAFAIPSSSMTPARSFSTSSMVTPSETRMA